MKKIDIWLFASLVLALLIDPDETDLFWVGLAWANLLFAIVSKSMTNENESHHEADNQ